MKTNGTFDMDAFRAKCKADAEAKAAAKAELSDDPIEADYLYRMARKAERDALSHKRAMGLDSEHSEAMAKYEASTAAQIAAMNTEPTDI